ncbi:suppressor of tumorigenicity 14 protein homolog [Mugil cephalus]|uniref:suppressor of tumorigenicity 14 protein homolog n=1 Tax=Mugil cephalus TaxID=48193 RepID=UPI001FB84AF2|nr:suppressor of tumorigenicity 14 protein homolog [Mugil cephalus]
MDLMDSGAKFIPVQGTDLDPTLECLQASDSKRLEKKPGCRKLLIGVVLVVSAAVLALLTGLLVWHFRLRNDVRVRRVYIGSMGISNKPFLPEYEDPSSSQFNRMASLVGRQLKLIYAKDSVLDRYFQSSTVDAFSEGDVGSDSIVVYYQSEFDVPIHQQALLDEAIEALELQAGRPMGRHGRLLIQPVNPLDVNSVLSRAIDPRLTRTSSERKTFNIHVRNSGLVQSPGFPDSSYSPNVYLQWRLRADQGHRVRLSFHTLILEDDCQQDFIKIYDSLAPIEHRALTEQCGYPHHSLSFLSSGNVMLLTLVTSEEKNFPGFRANYSQIPLTEPKCGGSLTADKGFLSSPFFPSNYPPRTSCVWSIQVATDKFVKIQFNTFLVGNESKQCSSDYVEVNGQRLCGHGLKSTVITSQSNQMTVKFNSDSSYVDQGFTAEYEAFIPTNPCPGKFQCSNNLCINKSLECDGWSDCGDNSDEANCTCEATQMKCKNGRCKPKLWQCDSVDDCGDNTDEETCVKCKGEFSCKNGRCVSEKMMCDGKNDCGDGSDESKCERCKQTC